MACANGACHTALLFEDARDEHPRSMMHCAPEAEYGDFRVYLRDAPTGNPFGALIAVFLPSIWRRIA